MLSAEHLYQLPLEIRIYIANMNMETYTQMYLYDAEFRVYASSINVIDMFIDRFVLKEKIGYISYKINNIEYIKYDNGVKQWYKNNKLHRENGPAILYPNGDAQWYINGTLHRLDGPALIWHGSHFSYYQNDKLHRLDGPAVVFSGGIEEYWLDGKRIYK